jgi:hypothetical protein
MLTGPMDTAPLWIFPLFVTVAGLLATECSYRFGAFRRRPWPGEESEGPVAGLTGAILGLLAFMLAFSFSMGACRFDARRQAVLAEANAVGTTWLRASLLPEPHGAVATDLLQRYAALRASIGTGTSTVDRLEQSEDLHKQMWSVAKAATALDTRSVMTGLFVQSLNETIDLHAHRVFVGIYNRIPLTIWLALLTLTLVGMLAVGFQSGYTRTRRSPESLLLILGLAGVLYLIVDLDRAHEGLLTVSQQAMVSLHESMLAGPP